MRDQRHVVIFFFNDTATTEIYTLSLHDALPILRKLDVRLGHVMVPVSQINELRRRLAEDLEKVRRANPAYAVRPGALARLDRKSTRLNSSHANISYAVFCLKKK